MSLFTCIDENELFDQLPRYVTDNLDAIPSTIRLYEGDSHGIVRGGATDIKMVQQNRGAAGTRIEAQAPISFPS